jgi:hypothetical protein
VTVKRELFFLIIIDYSKGPSCSAVGGVQATKLIDMGFLSVATIDRLMAVPDGD